MRALDQAVGVTRELRLWRILPLIDQWAGLDLLGPGQQQHGIPLTHSPTNAAWLFPRSLRKLRQGSMFFFGACASAVAHPNSTLMTNTTNTPRSRPVTGWLSYRLPTITALIPDHGHTDTPDGHLLLLLPCPYKDKCAGS